MTESNAQFKVEYRPGALRLMIVADDGSCRSIEVPPAVGEQIGRSIIDAAVIAGRGIDRPLNFDKETIAQAEQICRWVDEYARGVK